MASRLHLAGSVFCILHLGCTAGQCFQKGPLLFGCEAHRDTYEDICCTVPQAWAEPYGFLKTVNFFDQLEVKYGTPSEVVFYDAACGLPLYIAPKGRSYAEWKEESISHGWPSFREQEAVAENVHVEAGYNGELVSKCNTHLGHNLPDSKGRRDCVNLMCMAGVEGTGVVSSSGSTATLAPLVGDAAGSGGSGVLSQTPTSAPAGSTANGGSGQLPTSAPTMAPQSGGSGALPTPSPSMADPAPSAVPASGAIASYVSSIGILVLVIAAPS